MAAAVTGWTAREASAWMDILREPPPPGLGTPGERAAGLALTVLLCGLVLTLTHAYANPRGFAALPLTGSLPGDKRLWIYLYWLVFLLVFWVALPACATRRLAGEGPASLGLGLGRTRSCLGAYAVLYALNLPLILWVSRMPSFSSYYPFYKDAGRSLWLFLGWETIYAVQFVCVEFFFRGFMLHAARRALGGGAVAFTALPYCMLHFPKPFPEPLLALVMGLALGIMALRARSIWGGCALHTAIAVTMDVLALASRPGALAP